jgi:hypothetical protein
MIDNLVSRLRAWSRRYEPRSQERVLMSGAADRIEELEASTRAERAEEGITKDGESVKITADMVEVAMGGAKLFPWQRKKLEAPPSIVVE